MSADGINDAETWYAEADSMVWSMKQHRQELGLGQTIARTTKGLPTRTAFTLVELLVVIAIVSILAALLLPVLVGTKERSRRVNCINSQRQLILAIHMYGNDNSQSVPSGAPDWPRSPNDDHLPVLSTVTSNSLVNYLKSQQMFHCPSFAEQFKKDASLQLEAWGYGYVIGYNYHGGHANTPWPGAHGHTNTWVSPQKLTDSATLVLISDMNDWSYADGRTWAPHGKNGPILTGMDASNQQPFNATKRTFADIGAAGGNVGNQQLTLKRTVEGPSLDRRLAVA